MQSLATAASTYALQTLGLMAFAEGNVIQLNEARIGVVDGARHHLFARAALPQQQHRRAGMSEFVDEPADLEELK